MLVLQRRVSASESFNKYSLGLGVLVGTPNVRSRLINRRLMFTNLHSLQTFLSPGPVSYDLVKQCYNSQTFFNLTFMKGNLKLVKRERERADKLE